ALRAVEERVLRLARTALRPVGRREEGVDGLAVDAGRVVVDLEAVPELPSHADSVLSRKPPWNSYEVTTTASASRAARSPSASACARAGGLGRSARTRRTPSGESATVSLGAHAAQTAPPALGR